MKRHCAVFLLAVRSTVWKLTAILGGLAAAEAGLYLLRRRMLWGLPEFFDHWSFRLLWTLALVGTALVLWLSLCGKSAGRVCDLTGRLPCARQETVLWMTLHCLLSYLILWAFQLLLAYLLCVLHGRWSNEGPLGSQRIFLTFYASGVLHELLPLADGLAWTGVALLWPGLAMATAGAAVARWDGRWRVTPLAAAVWSLMAAGVGEAQVWSMLLGLGVLAVGWASAGSVWRTAVEP